MNKHASKNRKVKAPAGVSVVFRKVVKKSKSGVEYVRFVPTVEGIAPKGDNRLARRKDASWKRSAEYRKLVDKQAREKVKKAEKAHAEVVETAKKKASKKKDE